MPKFSISYDVTTASGTVTYTVEAATRMEAAKMLRNGEGFISRWEVEPHYNEVDFEKEVYEDPDAEEVNF